MTRNGPRFRTMRALGLSLAACLAFATAPLQPSKAAEDDTTGTFLSSFPDGEIYQLSIIGDEFASGMLDGFVESMASDGRLNIQRKLRYFPGIMTQDFDGKVQDLEQILASEPINVALVMVGDQDRVPLRSSSGKRVPVASPEWLTEYSRRVDRLMKSLKRRNPSVYWAGLPVLARPDANEQTQKMNDIIRERAYLNGFKYIDAYAGFADETGNYSAYGPDLQGKIRVLRAGDGVHFTGSGYRKLAHYFEKELRRDLNQAKANRSIPLLGGEEEQAKVNPDNANKVPSALLPGSETGAGAATANAAAPVVKAQASGTSPAAAGDQAADNGKISLRIPGATGREETQTIEIVRPAIPASVVQLMARREGAGQLGDMIVEQMPGGITLMNSITPAGNRARGKLSPTQAPYFRLLVKGERLPPKAGRADDVAWPPKPETSSRAAPPATEPRG